MADLQWLFPEFTNAEWLVHTSIFSLNILLFIFARPLLNIVDAGGESHSRVRLLRTLNVLVLALQIIDIILLRANSDYEHYFIKTGLSLMIIYAGLITYSFSAYFSRKKFGTEKELDKVRVFLESYSSRLVDIIILTVIIFSTVYSLILIWGANSLLETTGIFGIIFAFLAFTSNIWAPDIISGLIILNSQILEDGDVVVIDGYPDEYIISKVTFIYMILYDIRNNHRTLIRNSRFIQSKIDNLSRIASTDGIRKKLIYNIGYPDISQQHSPDRMDNLNKFRSQIEKVFSKAYDSAREQEEIKINEHKPFEWALTNTGNYALEYTLWVYLERIPNTKITATIRRHLMRTMYRINEEVFIAAVSEGLDLSTPDLRKLSIDANPGTLQ